MACTVLSAWGIFKFGLHCIFCFNIGEQDKEEQVAKFNDTEDVLAHNLDGRFTGVCFIFIAHY